MPLLLVGVFHWSTLRYVRQGVHRAAQIVRAQVRVEADLEPLHNATAVGSGRAVFQFLRLQPAGNPVADIGAGHGLGIGAQKKRLTRRGQSLRARFLRRPIL